MKIFVSVFVAAVLMASGATGKSAQLRRSPEFAFTIPGQGEHLLSQYRGKVVALGFILTTCPHCQAESKVMNRMQQRFGSQGFQALYVAVDPNAGLMVDNFAKDFHVGFPVGWSSMDHMMDYMGFTDRPAVPQLVLIDRQGNIHYETARVPDASDLQEETIASRIQELIAAGNRSKPRAGESGAR